MAVPGLVAVWPGSAGVCRFDLPSRFFENAQPVERSRQRTPIVKSKCDVLLIIGACDIVVVHCEEVTESAATQAT